MVRPYQVITGNNMKPLKLIIFLLLNNISNFSNIAFAGIVDVSLSIDLQLNEEVEYLQESTFSVTVTNHGPDIAGGDSSDQFPVRMISSSYYIPGNLPFIYITQNTSINQKCFFINSFGSPLPGGLPSIGYTFAFPRIPANSSITCYGKLKIGFEQGLKKIDFFAFSPTDNETNFSNNNIEFSFRIKPIPIPLFSFYNLLLLCLLIVGITWKIQMQNLTLLNCHDKN